MSKPPHDQRGVRASRPPDVPQRIEFTEVSYAGPLPPPEALRQYETACPGSAQVIVDAFRHETAHRRAIEEKTLEANVAAMRAQQSLAEMRVAHEGRYIRHGQSCGFVLSLLAIAGAAYGIYAGNSAVGAALAAIPTAGLIRSFFGERKADRRSGDEADKK